MPFVETVVPILLDRQRDLFFNANTFDAYEGATGKMYLETVALLYDGMRPYLEAQAAKKAGADEAVSVNAFDLIKRVPMKDLRALIWAALHEYGQNPADLDEPSWPLTINAVGRMIQMQDVPRIFTAFLKGQIKNSPNREEMGESPARPAPATALNGLVVVPKTAAADGGERSIALPADAFA